MPLGDLVKVPLRDVWSNEAASFTPWLAKPEQLKKLGETLGMELEPEDEEVSVGPFSADILCKDTVDGSWVVIENQIEKTDHRHLGQILTYAAGLGAKTMVWVAAEFTDEHRAALDWLNEHTVDEVSFFGLEIEVWRIDDSHPAPKFNIACKPNDWSKAVKSRVGSDNHLATPHRRLLLEFWTEFHEFVSSRSKLRPQQPSRQSWITFSIGRTGFHLSAIASLTNTGEDGSTSPEIRVALYLNSEMSKSNFKALENSRAKIDAEIGDVVRWYNPDDRQVCTISVRRDLNFTDRENWPDAFAWLLKYLEKFNGVFRPLIAGL